MGLDGIDVEHDPSTMGHHMSFGESLVCPLWKPDPFIKRSGPYEAHVFYGVGSLELGAIISASLYACHAKDGHVCSLHNPRVGLMNILHTPYRVRSTIRAMLRRVQGHIRRGFCVFLVLP